MNKDGITLKTTDPSKCAEDYGRRCKSFGLERRNITDLQDAMSHPEFKARHHKLLDNLANDFRRSKKLIERAPLWRVPLGTHGSGQELIKVLTSEGHSLNNEAKYLLENIDVAPKLKTIAVVITTAEELGLTNGGTFQQICVAASSLSLKLCPKEVGPQLRRLYRSQSKSFFGISIGMEPIYNYHKVPCVFYLLSLGDKTWLSTSLGDSDRVYAWDSRWAFARK